MHFRLIGECIAAKENCEDWVRDGPASGEKGSKGRNYLDCIRGNGLHLSEEILSVNRITDSSRGYACTALRQEAFKMRKGRLHPFRAAYSRGSGGFL